MKLKIKIRLRMLRDAISDFFTLELRKAIVYAFLTIILAITIMGSVMVGYYAGYTNGVNEMSNKYETDLPMCAARNTEVRENPTGFILSKINRGDVVWVVQLQVPFAVVWYSDGHSWYLGTTTASNLVPCINSHKEPL
jgi:hypothetical protein